MNALATPAASAAQPPDDRSLLASLKLPDYFFLWVGMLASAFAMNMQLVAQGWLVYEMTASAMSLVWVSLSFMAPQVVFSLAGGVLADRVPKKPVLAWAPVINGVATLALALVILFGQVRLAHFICVSLLNGTVMALSIPARMALIPEIVGERLMFNAMAYNMTAWNLSRILGPALAGFVIAIFAGGDTGSAFGVGLVYLALSALYFASGLSIAFIRHPALPLPGERASPLREMHEGMAYVLRSPVVGGLILLSILPFMFGLTINTLLPAFAQDVLAGGPDDLGLLMTAMGTGAILGSLTLAKMGSIPHKGYWIIGTGSLWGALLAAFAFTADFAQSAALVAVIGFITAVNMSMTRSLIQLQAERQMRGRIMSIDMMSHGLMLFGALPIGYIAESAGVAAGLMASGAILCLSTFCLGMAMPKVRAVNLGYAEARG